MRTSARRTGRRQNRHHAETTHDDGYAAELEELARLKEQGLISDADFEAKKKQILGI